MSKTLQSFSANSATDVITAALLNDGAVIINDIIESPLLEQLNQQLTPILNAADPEHSHLNPVLDMFFGARTRHVTGLVAKSALFAEQVMCHPVLLSLCDNILLPHCADYILNLAHIMDRGAGAERQLFHRDEDIWIHMPKQRPELEIAMIIAMVDFTRDNGATVVVPGSHQWQDRQHQDVSQDQLAYAEMPAGSAVIYLGSTLHAGGENISNNWRRGIHMSYCLGWLRTEENNVLATPPSVAKKLSKRARELVGYGVHDAINDLGGYLGMVDMQIPSDLLDKNEL